VILNTENKTGSFEEKSMTNTADKKPRCFVKKPLWIYPKIDKEWVDAIIEEFSIHPVTAELLAGKGFDDLDEIHDFLYGKLPNLIDPSLFPQMEQAVVRVLRSLKDEETILICGDNDVDGMSATALLVEFIRFLGGKALYYIPNRATLKKSVMLDAVDMAIQNNCRLLITVDCGITSAEEIAEAVRKNIDVIVTDHHEPTATLPHCIATLNPKLLNSTYPNRELTGVGVAFKLAHGITNSLIASGQLPTGKVDLKRYLDLVALGTVADMGVLLGENRILVRYGLKQLRKTKRIGLAKLFTVCDLKMGEIAAVDIASKIAPRLNSLGRIADPLKGVELLLIRDALHAENLAKELDLNNLERQKIERRDAEDLEHHLFLHPQIIENKAIVLASEKWHPGIIPILTARIAKQYNRPTVVIAIDQGLGKGSLRTIPEFPLLAHLKELSDLLEDFGGHDYAAGLTIKKENIPLFTKRFSSLADSSLKEEDLVAKLVLNANLPFKDLSYDFMESLELLEPFGNGNPQPVFYAHARQIWPPKIIGKTHLKLFLEDQDRLLEGIAFGYADKKEDLMHKNLKLRVAFTPQINNFLNKSSIQLLIRDVQTVAPSE
jgi:single-stranded-DNA-specific exonuclease